MTTGKAQRALIMAIMLLLAATLPACQQRTGKNGEKLSFKQELRAMVRGNRDRDKDKGDEKIAKIEPKERVRPEKPRKPKITLYVSRDCAGCKELEGFLRQNKVSFRKRDVEKTKQGRDFYATVGGALPITTVDTDVVRGYDPQRVAQTIQKRSLPPGQQQEDSYRF